MLKGRKFLKILWLALYGLFFLSLGIYLHASLVAAPTPLRVTSPAKKEVLVPDRGSSAAQGAFVKVAEQVTPAVVNISTVSTRKGKPPGNLFRPFGSDPFFHDFFDRFFEGRPKGHRQMSLGSGLIVDRAGYILTNNHVIKDADEITVKLANQQEYKGRVIGTDPKTDLAVIRIVVKEDLPVADLGDSDRLRVGEWAIAIGNPFGLDHTVTVGVISATGRSDVGIATYENFIQTDASINPGNSGGPLLNIKGEVIGINTAIVASGQGIGFAIPINMARKIVDDLVKKGKVTRGWLGVGIQPLTPELSHSFNLPSVSEGVLVNRIMPQSPAEAAGLREGDVITTLDGQKIIDPRQLQRMAADLSVGKVVEVQVLREGKPLQVRLRVGELPP
ncbi:MAG: Do family serine endopeptidase [candidate division NC10 bacterium]|nr:Do family serine endopeptidase [candidate division NC10 bacterium]